MVQPEIVRRPSYGPTSPVVGERGARTRRLIVDVTLELFAERGVNAVTVDDIATVAGVSRATLYQYFESKEQIFRELVEECGAALLRVMRRLGPLGPTAEGFDNLHWWLGEWAWVYERYATMFIQWAHVDSPDAPLRSMIAQWVEACAARVSARFVDAPVHGVDAEDLAVALWAMVERYNYYRHTRVTRLMDDAATDNLAIVAQLMIFPDTPTELLLDRASSRGSPSGRPVWPVRARPRSAEGAGSVEHTADRLAGLTVRTQRTVRTLLDAGSTLLAGRGYHGFSVDDVVAEAGVARGTFYKYFDDKLDLVLALSRECSAEIERLSAQFAEVGPGDSAALRSWLADFVALHQTHAGMFRLWLEGTVRHPDLQAAGWDAVSAALASISARLERVSRRYPLDIYAASIMLLGLLERFPDQALGTRYERETPQIVETMAKVIERGFLNPAAPSPKGRRAPGTR